MPGYKTMYICEGKTLNIVCEEGLITLIRANFGRFSISICNDHGNLEWRVNCMSAQSFLIMAERCSMKPNCSVNASSQIFQDPCPGTLKYLEVQYHCGTGSSILPVPSTTPATSLRATVSTNITAIPIEKIHTVAHRPITTSTLPTVPSTKVMQTSTTTVFPLQNFSTMSEPNSREYGVTENFMTIKITDVPTVDTFVTSSTPSSVTLPIPKKVNSCEATISSGIIWPAATAGEIVYKSCPEGTKGKARWVCAVNLLEWTPEIPDLQECHSVWLENIHDRIKMLQEGDSIVRVINELANMSEVRTLYSRDFKLISEIIQQAFLRCVSSVANYLDTWHRHYAFLELLQSSVKILNTLLEDKHKFTWMNMLLPERKTILSHLLERVDDNAHMVAETSSEDNPFSFFKSNVLLIFTGVSSRVVKSKNLQSLTFPFDPIISSEIENTFWRDMTDSVFVPLSAIEDYQNNGLYKVIFLAINNLNYFIKPSFFNSSREFIINSRILAATTNKARYVKIKESIVISFKHHIEENVSNPKCIHWNFKIRDWSEDSCSIQAHNHSHTICVCNHLSYYAVAMEVKPINIPLVNRSHMDKIILIGAALNLVPLIFTVMTLLILRSGSSDDSVFAHRNMFSCLLLAEFIFYIGLKWINNKIACSIIAAMLHYVLHVVFFWLFIECLHQFVNFKSSSEAKKSHRLWYYIISYTAPGIVLAISALIDPSNYGTRNYCWLRADNNFIYSFIAPAICFILGSCILSVATFTTFTLRISCKNAREEVDTSTIMKYRSWNRRSLYLIMLLSGTWSAAFAFLNYESIGLACVFSIFNSLLGISVFFLYCLQNEMTKMYIKRFFNCNMAGQETQDNEVIVDAVANSNPSAENQENPFWSLPTEDNSTSRQSETSVKQTRGSLNDINVDRRTYNPTWNGRKCSTLKPTFSTKPVSSESDTSNIPSRSRGWVPQGQEHALPSESQYADHIYESIDYYALEKEQEIKYSQIPHNMQKKYYGDHPDGSQKLSTGYKNQPRTPIGKQNGQSMQTLNYPVPHHLLAKCSNEMKEHWKTPNTYLSNETPTYKLAKNESDKGVKVKAHCNTLPNTNFSNAAKTLENPRHDIMHSKNLINNASVLAVLEGNKVVNKVHLEEEIQQYNLSTYC